MPKKKKSARKLTQAEKISRIPIEEVSKLGGSSGEAQLRKYVTTLMSGYKRRVQSFARKGLTSYAQISLESSIAIPSRSPRDMTRNQLLMEFARYSKFFNDVTSTESGIKEVNREQDARIFGVDKRGMPRKTLTQEERIKFWNLYDEFLNQNPNADYRYGSESVQQALADMMLQGETNENNITLLLDSVAVKLEQKQRESNVTILPNVYSGRGPTVQ